MTSSILAWMAAVWMAGAAVTEGSPAQEDPRLGGTPAQRSTEAADRGLELVLAGDHEGGARLCQTALAEARETKAVQPEAKALSCLGEIEYQRGDLRSALSLYEQAKLLSRGAGGDTKGEARALYLLGVTHSDLGDVELATDRQREALGLWRQVGDKQGELRSLVALGRLYDRVGESQSALNAFAEAMHLAEAVSDPLGQAMALSGTALVYLSLGDGEAHRWRRARELWREIGIRLAEADLLLHVGMAHLVSGEPAAARDQLREALALSRELENPIIEARALRFLGLTHQLEGEAREALDLYRLGLSRMDTFDRRFESRVRSDMGDAYLALGDADEALRNYERAAELSRAIQDRLGEAMGLFGVARATAARNGLLAARAHLQEALEIAESLRAGAASPDLRSSYMASVYRYYELNIELLMRLDRETPGEGLVGEALAASERARARSLLESLAEARIDVRGGADPGLLDREERLKRSLDAKSERLMRLLAEGQGEEAAKLEEEIDELTSRYDLLQAEIRSKSPRYAALTQPQPLDLAGIREKVVDSETLLLEYALGEERSYLWAVSQGELRSHELPPRAEIEGAARHVYDLLTARLPAQDETAKEARRRVREADEAYWAAAGELSEMLLGPVAEVMAGRRLLVVSDGALQFLPFAALPVPGTTGDPVPLVARHEVVHLPSASALAVLRERDRGTRTSGRTVAVLADPVFETDDPRVSSKTASVRKTDAQSGEVKGPAADWTESSMQSALRAVGFMQDGEISIPRLVATRREARAIAGLAPDGTSFTALGFDANLATARSPELGRYPIVHFATHGLVNSENPGLSGILLSMVDADGEPQPGFLTLDDIYDLELPAELVVLSACSTALGKEVRGEGLVGIVRGFMYAGAERVVASLWKVDDQATGELMKRFYRHMLEEKSSPAAALRQAQIEMWREGEFRQPFYWAAFVLQGEWR
jgi:CHAT domain-containing protein